LGNNKTIRKQDSKRKWKEIFNFSVRNTHFDLILLIIFIILYISYTLIYIFVLGMGDIIMQYSTYLLDIIIVVVFIGAIVLKKKIPKGLLKLIQEFEINKGAKPLGKEYENYKDYIEKTFDSKWGPIILVIGGIGGGILLGFIYIVFKLPIFGGITLDQIMAGPNGVFGIINIGIFVVIASFFIWVVGSNAMIILFTYICINKLGTKNDAFHLEINYKELKLGKFNDIGKFIISFTIPLLILTTLTGILGMFWIFLGKTLVEGFFVIGIGLGAAIILSILFFKNTIHIHEAIKEKKDFYMGIFLDELVEVYQMKNLDLNNINNKYQTLKSIHETCDKVDDISDWPFNPSSVKKLAIFLASSVVPLIISFFGLG